MSNNATLRQNQLEGRVCGGSENEDVLLLCDRCDAPYHCYCLSPALTIVPMDDWFCPECASAPSEAPIVIDDDSQSTLATARASTAADSEADFLSSTDDFEDERDRREPVREPSSPVLVTAADVAAIRREVTIVPNTPPSSGRRRRRLVSAFFGDARPTGSCA